MNCQRLLADKAILGKASSSPTMQQFDGEISDANNQTSIRIKKTKLVSEKIRKKLTINLLPMTMTPLSAKTFQH